MKTNESSNRRDFLRKSGMVAGATTLFSPLACVDSNDSSVALDRQGSKTVANIKHLEDGSFELQITDRVLSVLPDPIFIDRIEIVETKNSAFCVVYDQNGNTGITKINDNRLYATFTMFQKLVVPPIIGVDARYVSQLPSQLSKHDRNYKLVSLGFWNGVGIVEIAIWDLLGRIAGKPAYEFLSERIRDSYPVYISSLEREAPFEEETERILETLEAIGAKAVKFKIGGRMKNTEPYITRTNKWVPYLREKVGSDITLYVDGNSSYTTDEAIEILKLLEDFDIKFFEEPCYWQDLWSHKLVKEAATTCKIAGGEQDFSFDTFKLMANLAAMDVLQPDAYYHGGLVRTLKIAHLAKTFGLDFTPHSPKSGPMAAAPNQIFAVAPILSNHQEYRVMGHKKQKDWHNPIVPQNGELNILETPGLGMVYDENIWKKSKPIWSFKA